MLFFTIVFSLVKKTFFFSYMYVCNCVSVFSMCTRVQIPMEDRGIGVFGAGEKGRCKPLDVLRTEFRSSSRAAYALNF